MGRINELWAFVAEDTGPDDEGVIATSVPMGGGRVAHLPLVGADAKRMVSLKGEAQAFADAMGKPVKLLMFSVRHEVETLMPHGAERNGH